MRIRSEQLREIEAVRAAHFCKQLCAELRAELPGQTSRLSDGTLLRIVSKAIEKTRRYKITSGDGVRRFVKLAVLVDPQFDEVPDVQRFLKLPDLDPELKIKLLSELTAQQLRSKVT